MSNEIVSPVGSEAPGDFEEERRAEHEMQRQELKHRFRYHAPSDIAKSRHEAIRDALGGLANSFHDVLPDGQEKDQAILKLEEAMFWANAAIARKI